MVETMLTTVDNPYNPFDHFDQWLNWDVIAGYNTCSLLNRICKNSEELSPKEQEEVFRDAMLDILDNDATGMFSIICKGEKTPLNAQNS